MIFFLPNLAEVTLVLALRSLILSDKFWAFRCNFSFVASKRSLNCISQAKVQLEDLDLISSEFNFSAAIFIRGKTPTKQLYWTQKCHRHLSPLSFILYENCQDFVLIWQRYQIFL